MVKLRATESRSGESEKITINLGFVDLGQIDLIVSDGFYANRTDFIRTAIRNHLDKYSKALAKSLERKNFDLGLHDYSREFLEDLKRSGQTVHIHVIGLAEIADDVSVGPRTLDDCIGRRPRRVSSESLHQGRPVRPLFLAALAQSIVARSFEGAGKSYCENTALPRYCGRDESDACRKSKQSDRVAAGSR